MPRTAFTPPVNTAPSITPQIEAQRPMEPRRGGITTLAFVVILVALGAVVYTTSLNKRTEDKAAVVTAQENSVKTGTTVDTTWADYLAHTVPARQFNGIQDGSQFIVNPALATCSPDRRVSNDPSQTVITCSIPVNDFEQPTVSLWMYMDTNDQLVSCEIQRTATYDEPIPLGAIPCT